MQYVNLVPDSSVRKQLRRVRALRWGCVAFGVFLVVIGYSFLVGRRVATTKQHLVPLERRLAEKQELVGKVAKLEAELQRAVEKQDTVNELLDDSEWAKVLADIAEAARDNAWLERLKFTKVRVYRKPKKSETSGEDGEKEEGREIIEIKFSAHGYAPSNFELANFMARLKRSSYFDDVELNYSELTEADKEEPLIKFAIEGCLL